MFNNPVINIGKFINLKFYKYSPIYKNYKYLI